MKKSFFHFLILLVAISLTGCNNDGDSYDLYRSPIVRVIGAIYSTDDMQVRQMPDSTVVVTISGREDSSKEGIDAFLTGITSDTVKWLAIGTSSFNVLSDSIQKMELTSISDETDVSARAVVLTCNYADYFYLSDDILRQPNLMQEEIKQRWLKHGHQYYGSFAYPESTLRETPLNEVSSSVTHVLSPQMTLYFTENLAPGQTKAFLLRVIFTSGKTLTRGFEYTFPDE